MERERLFVTGASGLIGRELVAAARADGVEIVRALSRGAGPAESVAGTSGPGKSLTGGSPLGEPASVEWVRGDLRDPGPWAARLEGCRAVLHLGASTGRASADVHRATNLEATRALIRAARDAGVPRFVFVSTIAAGYPELERYPYAAAKREAEEAVRASSLAWTVLRPTIVLGAASGIGPALAKFARLPLTPLFGSGGTRVQPIAAHDCARLILEAAREAATVGATIDLGGPDVITFRELLARLRVAFGREGRHFLRLPLSASIRAAWIAERVLGPRLPVLAGQLYSFRYDSTARSSPFLDRRASTLMRLDDVIAKLAAELADDRADDRADDHADDNGGGRRSAEAPRG